MAPSIGACGAVADGKNQHSGPGGRGLRWRLKPANSKSKAPINGWKSALWGGKSLMSQTLGSELPTGTGFVSYAIRKLGAAGLRVAIKRAIAGVATLAVETA